MGLNILSSSSSFDKIPTECVNPDPKNFRIIKHQKINNFLLVMIKYPDAKNYEGQKILMFRNIELTDLLNQGVIDPHFSDNKRYISPVARFEPTDYGWQLATKLAWSY